MLGRRRRWREEDLDGVAVVAVVGLAFELQGRVADAVRGCGLLGGALAFALSW